MSYYFNTSSGPSSSFHFAIPNNSNIVIAGSPGLWYSTDNGINYTQSNITTGDFSYAAIVNNIVILLFVI
jgi:hypothetical protein